MIKQGHNRVISSLPPPPELFVPPFVLIDKFLLATFPHYTFFSRFAGLLCFSFFSFFSPSHPFYPLHPRLHRFPVRVEPFKLFLPFSLGPRRAVFYISSVSNLSLSFLWTLLIFLLSSVPFGIRRTGFPPPLTPALPKMALPAALTHLFAERIFFFFDGTGNIFPP